MSTRSKSSGKPLKAKTQAGLERIIGNTVRSNATFSLVDSVGSYAYAAGSVAVVCSVQECKPVYYTSPVPRTISALSLSPNGKQLAVEKAAAQSSILIWDVSTKKLVSELKGQHKGGIGVVKFSPNCRWLVSVGYSRDQYLYLWDLRDFKAVACAKLPAKAHALSFTEDGLQFVVAGAGYLKLYDYADPQGCLIKSETTYKGMYILEGRSFLFPKAFENLLTYTYVDVVCTPALHASQGAVFAVTSAGQLIQAERETRKVIKGLNLRVTSASSLSYTADAIAFACDNGIIRLFHPVTLEHINTLPKPSSLDSFGGENGGQIYPDVCALGLSTTFKTCVAIYTNSAMLQWTYTDSLKQFSLAQENFAHGAAIWDAISLENGQLVTTAADHLVRVWDVIPSGEYILKGKISVAPTAEDIKVRSLDPNQLETSNFVGEGGVKRLALSPDGLHLAGGDLNGNLHLFDLDDCACIASLAAHESEILSLSYSIPQRGQPQYLATASRDRLIHLFEREGDDYSLKSTLDDHQASVMSVKFAECNGETRLISCSNDKSIIFRSLNPAGNFIQYHRDLVTAASPELLVDPLNTQLLVACADKKISSWDIATGKRNPNTGISVDGEAKACRQQNIEFDPSGKVLITSSQDKYIRLYDCDAVDSPLLCRLHAHSEIINRVRMTFDCSRLVSVGADGLLIVWRLAPELAATLRSSFTKVASTLPRMEAKANISISPSPRSYERTQPQESKVQLPVWVTELIRSNSSGDSSSKFPSNIDLNITSPKEPKSRWGDMWRREAKETGLEVYLMLTQLDKPLINRPFTLEKAVPEADRRQSNGIEAEFLVDVGRGEIKEIVDPAIEYDENLIEPDMFQDIIPDMHLPPKKDDGQKAKRLSLSARFHNLSRPASPAKSLFSVESTPDSENIPSKQCKDWSEVVAQHRQRLRQLGLKIDSPTSRKGSSDKNSSETVVTSTTPLPIAPVVEVEKNIQSTRNELEENSPNRSTTPSTDDSSALYDSDDASPTYEWDFENEEDDAISIEKTLSNLRNVFDLAIDMFSLAQQMENHTRPFEELFAHMRERLDTLLPPSREQSMLENYYCSHCNKKWKDRTRERLHK